MTLDPVAKQIADEAIDWILRQETGLSEHESEAFEQWRLADPRHEQALARLKGLWRELDEVPAFLSARRGWRPPVPPRWSWALAASLAMAWMLTGTQWLTRMGADYSTGVGEQRDVRLADGSVVKLDSGSVLDVDFAANRRQLRLLTGRALFIVTPDRDRPFVVEAGKGSATALGTRFVVTTDGDATSVVVTEHRVAVRLGAAPLTVLSEGQITGWRARTMQAVRPVDLGDSTAWTRGRLVVSGAPLHDVVAEIGRYRPGYVGLMGDAGMIRVSGVYDLTRPDQALEALRQTLGLRQIRLTDRFIVLRR